MRYDENDNQSQGQERAREEDSFLSENQNREEDSLLNPEPIQEEVSLSQDKFQEQGSFSNLDQGQEQALVLNSEQVQSRDQSQNNFASLSRSDHTERNISKKRGLKGYFVSSFAGVLVGALLVYLVLTNFTNIAPPPGNTSNNKGKDLATTNLSLDVSSAITKAAEDVSEAVVGVTNIQKTQSFFGETSEQEAGTGSGVIYKIDNKKAYIVTNNHVVEDSTSLEVTLKDGTKVPAEVIGGDNLTDLAVISIPSDGISKVADFGDSDSLKTGENVIAIGNPLGLRFSGSVTSGIISGVNRTVPIYDAMGTVIWNADVIQTDAAINPGNSGGALVNMRGQVIGINSSKINAEAVEGMGFSIPVNIAQDIIKDLEQYGKVKRPLLGIDGLMPVSALTSFQQQETLKLPEGLDGVVVQSIPKGSPADKAGLQNYDVIVEINGEETADVIELRKVLYKNKIGDTVEVKFYRDGKLNTMNVTLGESA